MSKFTDFLRDQWQEAQRPIGERYTERYNAMTANNQLIQQRRAAKAGLAQSCPVCGTTTTRKPRQAPFAVCPICLSHWDGSPPSERQVIRTYRPVKAGWGKFHPAEQEFRREAALMSRAGWRVANQSQGSTHYQGTTGEVIATYERVP